MPQSPATQQHPPLTDKPSQSPADPVDLFPHRHLGSGPESVSRMLHIVGHTSLDNLIDAAVPDSIRLEAPLNLPSPVGENEVLRELRKIGSTNKVHRSLIGMGYNDCVTPPVIQRNILENPGWYTQYTPYQAEISQG
jgi:glycine dehydrogenase